MFYAEVKPEIHPYSTVPNQYQINTTLIPNTIRKFAYGIWY